MSDLTAREKRILERRLNMGGGFILEFSNRTLAEFVQDVIGIDPYDAKYDRFGTSKANRVRAIWQVEPNHVVGKLLTEMLESCRSDSSPDHEPAIRIATRLLQSAPVDIEALTPEGGGKDFDLLVREVQAAITRNEPEAGLDRLHTYTIKFFKMVAGARGVITDRDKPLHSIVGEYVKAIKAAGLLESQMSERILKSSISTLESFNKIRNDRSLAHDNETLGYDESLLIFNHVCGVVRFVRSIEEREKLRSQRKPAAPEPDWWSSTDDEIPF